MGVGAGSLHDEFMNLEQEGVMFAFCQCVRPAQHALRVVREDGDSFVGGVAGVRGMQQSRIYPREFRPGDRVGLFLARRFNEVSITSGTAVEGRPK